MAEIAHPVETVTTNQTTDGSTNWFTAATLAAPAAGTYLIIVTAQVGGTANNRSHEYRTLYGATEFPGSYTIREPAELATTSRHSYGFMTTQALNGSEAITFEQKSQSSGYTSHANQIQILAIRLDADLTAADWGISKNASTANFVYLPGTTFPSLTVNSAANEDWLILSCASYAVDSFNSNVVGYLDTSGAVGSASYLAFNQEGEKTDEQLNWLTSRAFTLPAGASTFSMRIGGDSTSGALGQHIHSAVFALRLGAFETHAFVADDGLVPALATASTTLTTAITPVNAADCILIGGLNYTAFLSYEPGAKTWIEADAAVTPTGADTYGLGANYDTSDYSPANALAVKSLSAASHTINLRMQRANTAASNQFIANRTLVAFSTWLSGGVAGYTAEPSTDLVSTDIQAPTTDVSRPFSTLNTSVDLLAPRMDKGQSPSLETVTVALQAPTIDKTNLPTQENLTVALQAPTLNKSNATATPLSINVDILAPVVVLTGGGEFVVEQVPLLTSTAAIQAPTIDLAMAMVTDSIQVAIQPPTIDFALSPTTLSVPVSQIAPTIDLGIYPSTQTVTVTLLSDVRINLGIYPSTLAVPIFIPLQDVISGTISALRGLVWRVDPADFPSGTLFRVEYTLSQDAAGTIWARLVRLPVGIPVADTEVSTTEVAEAMHVSADVLISSLASGVNDYQTEVFGPSGGQYRWHATSVRIEAP